MENYIYLTLLLMTVVCCKRYQPNWPSLESRPLPDWYDKSKIGIFLHWGVFSVPSYRTAWFWEEWKHAKDPDFVNFMKRSYKPTFTYADFAEEFTAELFNPDDWADIFKASGAKYVVLTSKHHEGFCNWPSKHSFQWNSKDVGPNKDLVGLLAESIRKRTSIHFGLYHSLLEFFNPLYLEDKKNGFQTNSFVWVGPNAIQITSAEKSRVLGHQVLLNDVYYASEIEEVCLVDDNQFTLTISNETGPLSFIHNDCDNIVHDIIHIRTRWELSQPDTVTVHTKIRPKDVPGTLLNVMYPSLQAKIRGNIGQVADLLDMVLDSFIKSSVTGGLGSIQAEIMADTAVALTSANVQLVSRKVIGRFCRSKTIPELYELVNTYKPDVVWSDGEWEAPDWYWNSTEFIAWLYNDSPVKRTVVTNDRWGKGTLCKHGGFFTCHDRFDPGVLQKKKWENAMTVDSGAWEYRRDASLKNILSVTDIVTEVVRTVSCGGNILINVGPTKDGRINPIFEERLKGLGKWLDLNGAAIYETTPWIFQNDTKTPNVWYTLKNRDVYAIVLEWPEPGLFHLECPKPTDTTDVSLLGFSQTFNWSTNVTKNGIDIEIPIIPFNKMPCEHAWVFKMKNLIF